MGGWVGEAEEVAGGVLGLSEEGSVGWADTCDLAKLYRLSTSSVDPNEDPNKEWVAWE